MADRILFENPDGMVRHVIPAIENRLEGESLDDFVERTALKDVLPGETRMPPHTKLPIRNFRGCWRAVGGAVQVDMPLARAQRMGEIRMARDGKLKAADGPTARETEQGGPNRQAWVDYKQSLRDLPGGIDLGTLTTPEELEAFEPVWPTEPGA